jgi:hypothetical protein
MCVIWLPKCLHLLVPVRSKSLKCGVRAATGGRTVYQLSTVKLTQKHQHNGPGRFKPSYCLHKYGV